MKFSLTLRARIALTTAGVTALALILLALGSWVYIYLEELEAIDEHLQGESLELLSDLTENAIDADEFLIDEFEPRLGLAVFDRNHAIVGITPSFPSEIAQSRSAADGFRFESFGDSRWRINRTTSDDFIVSAGHNLEEFDDVLSDFAVSQFVLIPVVTFLAAWASWLVAGRSLRPIRQATLSASSIGSNDLSARLPVVRVDDEIGQFTIVLNRMLERIEKNYLQAKRFAGDASHELRTPLTIIKGELENLIAKNGLHPVAEQRITSAQQEVDRMHQIIDQLLLLARFDTGKASFEHITINLSQMIADMAEDIDLLSAKSNLTITSNVTPDIYVKGDASQLHRLWLNLFSNAAKYNRLQGSIDYRLSPRKQSAVFDITNTGPVIESSDSERIFERFFQTDSSHSDHGNGLGLSLCREIVHAHGGHIRLVSSTPTATHFEVELPLLPDS